MTLRHPVSLIECICTFVLCMIVSTCTLGCMYVCIHIDGATPERQRNTDISHRMHMNICVIHH